MLSDDQIVAFKRIEAGVGTVEDYELCKDFIRPDENDQPILVTTAAWKYNGVYLKLADGFMLNPDLDKVNQLTTAISKHTDGHCPCVPKYVRSADTLCPCLGYRSGEGCACGLYVVR